MVIVITKTLDTYIIAHVQRGALTQNTPNMTFFSNVCLYPVKTKFNRNQTHSHTIKGDNIHGNRLFWAKKRLD